MLRMREENFSGEGSMCGRLLLVSAISSISKKMAPGMCSSRYSARAFLPSPGMCQEALMMTMSGASSSAASSSVSVNHDLARSVISNPNLDEHGRCRWVAGKADGAGNIDAARPAEAKTFLAEQVEQDRQRLGVGDLIGLVDHRTFEIGGD